MTVGVAGFTGDDGILRIDSCQKIIAAGCTAAVMAYLEHCAGETITFTPLGPADDGYNYETGEQTYIINTNSLHLLPLLFQRHR